MFSERHMFRSQPVESGPKGEVLAKMTSAQTVTPARRSQEKGSPKGSAQWTESSSPTEVFDIGHDSEEDDVGPISSAVRSLNVDGALAPADKSWMPWTVDRSPDSGVGEGSTAPSSISKAVAERSKDRADVWTVEDWDTQLARMKEVPTPCRVPDGADAKQKQVADAVRAELQVDLEALVNATMDEMRSWVSQEIAFARSSFKEEAQRFMIQESKQDQQDHLDVQELKSKLKENEQLIEKLTKEIQDQGRNIKRMHEEVEPRASTSCERVAEARAVAEERKWRLRLEHFETTIARSSDELALCNRKLSELEDRAASNDSDLQRGLSTIQAADGHITEALKETKQLRQSSEKQVEELRHLEKQQQVMATEMESKAGQRQLDSLHKIMGDYDHQLNALQQSATELTAHQKELDSFQKLVEDHDERLKVIQQESTQLMNAQQATEEAHQNELDSLQRLLDDHDERLNVIQQESNQLINTQETTKEATQTKLDNLHNLIGDHDHQLNALQAAMELTTTQEQLQACQNELASLQILMGDLQKVSTELAESQQDNQEAHQKELDSLQKLVEAHDERLIVIQQESTQLMNAQQATEEAHQKELDGLQRLLDDHDERLNVIQQESNQLMTTHKEDQKECHDRIQQLTTTQRLQKEEMLSLTTSFREIQGITSACRSESLSLDTRMESALHRLQEVSLQVMKHEEQVIMTHTSVQSMMCDLQTCQDGVARSSMRLDHQQEALDHLNNRRCAMETRVTTVEEEVLKKFHVLDREVANNEKEITNMQDFLEGHSERLEDLRCRHGMQEERLRHVETTTEELEEKGCNDRQELARLSNEVSQHGQQIQIACLEATEQSKLCAAFIDRLENQEASFQRLDGCCKNFKQENENLQEQLDALKDGTMSSNQRLREMEENLERVEEIQRQPTSEMTKMQSDIETILDDTGKWREAMDRMEIAIQTNVSKTELQHQHDELQTWITDTRLALDRWLTISLDRFQKEQGYILQQNLGSVQRVKHWLEQIHIREKGLSHVILHITQQASPEIMQLLEEALKMPKKPNWDLRPDLALQQ